MTKKLNEVISIIIPTFKSEKTIGYCLESVIKQSYHNFVCLIIDYNCDNKTKEVVNKYAIKDNRIKYILSPNKGAAAQREYGISLVETDYVCFLDSDDIFDKDFIYVLYTNITNYKLDIVQCEKTNVESIDDANTLQSTKKNIVEKCKVLKLSNINNIRENIRYISLHTKMVKTALAKASLKYYNHKNNIESWEDTIITYFILYNCDSIGIIESTLYYQINNPNSFTHTQVIDNKYWIDSQKVVKTLLTINKEAKHIYNKKQNTIYATFSFASILMQKFNTSYKIFKRVFQEYRSDSKQYFNLKLIRCCENEFSVSEKVIAFAYKYNISLLAFYAIKRLRDLK